MDTPLIKLPLPRTHIYLSTSFCPPSPPTVYTQVESELVSIRAEWTQTVAARVLR